MVLMEAMATELPVVTTRIAGIPELVTDGESGVVVEPGDRVAVTRALSRLAARPDLRSTLGRRGRQVVLGSFTAGPNAAVLAHRFAAVSRSGVPRS